MTSGSECGCASTLEMTGIRGLLMAVDARASLPAVNENEPQFSAQALDLRGPPNGSLQKQAGKDVLLLR